jgi:hypothetical protein
MWSFLIGIQRVIINFDYVTLLETTFGTIIRFVEIMIDDEIYAFASIQPLSWNGSFKLHLIKQCNKYATDNQPCNDRKMIPLNNLKRIVGLIRLPSKVNNIDCYVIMPFNMWKYE